MIRKLQAAFRILILLSIGIHSSLCIPIPLAAAEDGAPGSISLLENKIPFLRASYEDYSFKLELKGYFIKISPFIIYNGTHYSLKQIINWIKIHYPSVSYRWLLKKAREGLHYGFNITQIPWDVADKIDYMGFRLLDLNFPLSYFELSEEPDRNVSRIEIPRANLVLSFEDLFPWGYTVKYTNSTYVLIGEVRGQANLFLDPLVLSGDHIIITGFSEGDECDLDDVYQADLDETYLLMDDATQGSGQSLTNQVRPADSGALRLTLNVTTYTTPKGDITILGKDFFDDPLNESIEISTVGVYYTQNYYKSVDSSGLDIEPDITVDIIQPRWGLLSKMENAFYCEAEYIGIGDGSTETWFAMENVTLLFSNSYTFGCFYVKPQAHFRGGELYDSVNKLSQNGVVIAVNMDRSRDSIIGTHPASYQNLMIELYDSKIIAYNFLGLCVFTEGDFIYNCVFEKMAIAGRGSGTFYTHDLTITHCQDPVPTNAIAFGNMPGEHERIFIYDASRVFFLYGGETATWRDVLVRNSTYILRWKSSTSTDCYMINVDSNTWEMDWDGGIGYNAFVYRQYDLDVTAKFMNGSLVEGANVTIYNSYLDQSWSWITGSNGSIPSQVFNMGHYYRYAGGTFVDYNPYELSIVKGDYSYGPANFTHATITDFQIALRRKNYTCSWIGTNNTVAGENAALSSNWDELNSSTGLSHFLLSTNNTGTWLNNSWSSSWIDDSWAVNTVKLNSTEQLTIAFKHYVNDTTGAYFVSPTAYIHTPLIHVPVGPFVGVTHRVDYGFSLLVASPLRIHPSFNQFLESEVEIPLDLIILNRENRARELQLSYSIASENGELIKEGEIREEIGPRAQDLIPLSFVVPFGKREDPKNFTVNLEADGGDPIEYQIQVSHDPWFSHLYNLAFILAAVGVGCILYGGYKILKRREKR